MSPPSRAFSHARGHFRVSRVLLDELRKTKTAQSLYSAFTHFRVSRVLLDELRKKRLLKVLTVRMRLSFLHS